ncbi:MAG: ABC transporter ATP-binding protein [Spirochaetaceae bacterium]|nr:ABC transporter ATP-binding protein [Spirochaetaceae bacterium]
MTAGDDGQSAAVSFRDFSFKYASQTEPTLFGINLAIQRGEKILIAGPSGCGKSTLAHAINGLIPNAFPGTAGGTLHISGREAFTQDVFTRSQTVGTVLQDTDGQFVGLSAAEDIAFAAENNCVPQDEMRARVREAAALARIDTHLAKSPYNLSGGQKQRVSLAGLLVCDVDILLFDEPLANLDPATGEAAIELIDWLHRSTGKTVIIIEHRLEDVLHKSVDRVVVMRAGRIAACAPPAAILSGTVLGECGLREPLYLAALKTAGAGIAADGCESVETVTFDSDALRSFYAGAEDEPPPPARKRILTAENIGFRYADDSGAEAAGSAALDGISFNIQEGEMIAIAGANGAGKSTLAKLIAGFITPQTGKLYFQDENMAPLSIRERSARIGCVMQNPNQMISFPMVFDEAAFALRNAGLDEAVVCAGVYEALTVCGLHPFRNWPVSALSYGQKKRLTIASILVTRPRVLLLDEPTAGQDFRHYTAIMEFLRALNRENGLTVVMITHDMHLMLEYTSRAFVLAGGRLLCCAPASEVLTRDELIREASLKKTSLYTLARRAGLEDAQGFIRRFMYAERRRRTEEAL